MDLSEVMLALQWSRRLFGNSFHLRVLCRRWPEYVLTRWRKIVSLREGGAWKICHVLTVRMDMSWTRTELVLINCTFGKVSYWDLVQEANLKETPHMTGDASRQKRHIVRGGR